MTTNYVGFRLIQIVLEKAKEQPEPKSWREIPSIQTGQGFQFHDQDSIRGYRFKGEGIECIDTFDLGNFPKGEWFLFHMSYYTKEYGFCGGDEIYLGNFKKE